MNVVAEITSSLNQKVLIQFHLGLFDTFSPMYSLQPQSKNMNIGLTRDSVTHWLPLPDVTRVGMATAGTGSSGPMTLIRHKLQKMDGLLIRHMWSYNLPRGVVPVRCLGNLSTAWTATGFCVGAKFPPTHKQAIRATVTGEPGSSESQFWAVFGI